MFMCVRLWYDELVGGLCVVCCCWGHAPRVNRVPEDKTREVTRFVCVFPLQSYNNFIQKTEAELSKEPDSLHATKPQIKVPTASERPRVKPPPPDRYSPAEPSSWIDPEQPGPQAICLQTEFVFEFESIY